MMIVPELYVALVAAERRREAEAHHLAARLQAARRLQRRAETATRRAESATRRADLARLALQ